MKRIILFIALLTASVVTQAAFAPNTILTATALNNALAAPAITGGSINGSTSILTTGAVTLNGVNTFGATANAVTQSYLDSSTLLSTTAFTKQTVLAAMGTIPIAVTSGTYNFASAGTGAIFGVTTSGGALASITSVIAPGTNYQVGDCLVMVGGNGDAIAYVSAVSGGAIVSASVLYGGTNYSGTPQLSGLALPPGSRSGNLTGALTGNVTIIIPGGTLIAGARRVGFSNNTTGAFTVTVKLTNGAGGSTGTGVVLPQGTGNNTTLLIYTNGSTDVWPEVGSAPNFVVGSSLTVAGVPVLGRLSGTTPSLGGAGLANGNCTTVTATVTGATVGMGVNVTPGVDPGTGFYWYGFVSSANTITARVCSAQGGTNTPTASVYAVRVMP